MPRTRVKICGVTRVEDALLAARAGADAIGIVLNPASKRNVPIERAAAIVAALPAFVTPVGVFVDAGVEQVRSVADRVGLRHVQLNGGETASDVARLAPLRVIKAIRVTRGGLTSALAPWKSSALPHLAAFILEPGHSKEAGGSGVENDWQAIAAAQAGGLFEGLPPAIAAGGLTPANVGEVARLIQPWAVDVSSGVEGERIGEKDAGKLGAFIEAARSGSTDA